MQRPLTWCTAVVLLMAAVLAAPSVFSDPDLDPTLGASDQPSGDRTGPGGAAGGSVPKKFFLHAPSASEEPCGEGLTLETADRSGGDSCGEVSPRSWLQCYVECDFASGDTFAAAKSINETVSGGYTATMFVYLATKVPDQLWVASTLSVGALQCYGNSGNEGGNVGIGFGGGGRLVPPGEWVLFEYTCTFLGGGHFERSMVTSQSGGPGNGPGEGPNQPGEGPKGTGPVTFLLQTQYNVNYFIGLEGAHASYLTFGADPPETKNTTRNETRTPLATPAKAPGPALGLALLSMAALVEVARRRRG